MFKIVHTHKLASAMGVLTLSVGVTSKFLGRAKIIAYATVTNMTSARDTIWERLDDMWCASLGMPEGTKMFSSLLDTVTCMVVQ